jgi:hypothetical protein
MPRYYLNDFDEKFRYIDDDGHPRAVALRDLSVDELLRVVRYYKISREPSWNESTLTERLRAAMPKWDGNLQNIDHAIRWYWRDRIMQARPFRDV